MGNSNNLFGRSFQIAYYSKNGDLVGSVSNQLLDIVDEKYCTINTIYIYVGDGVFSTCFDTADYHSVSMKDSDVEICNGICDNIRNNQNIYATLNQFPSCKL
jgi:hypothetical protein